MWEGVVKMGKNGAVIHWFDREETNPGCDCGAHDAVVRVHGGALLCDTAAREAGLIRPVESNDAEGE